MMTRESSTPLPTCYTVIWPTASASTLLLGSQLPKIRITWGSFIIPSPDKLQQNLWGGGDKHQWTPKVENHCIDLIVTNSFAPGSQIPPGETQSPQVSSRAHPHSACMPMRTTRHKHHSAVSASHTANPREWDGVQSASRTWWVLWRHASSFLSCALIASQSKHYWVRILLFVRNSTFPLKNSIELSMLLNNSECLSSDSPKSSRFLQERTSCHSFCTPWHRDPHSGTTTFLSVKPIVSLPFLPGTTWNMSILSNASTLGQC